MPVTLTEDERNAQLEYEHLFQVYQQKKQQGIGWQGVSLSELETMRIELEALYKRMKRTNKIDNLLDE